MTLYDWPRASAFGRVIPKTKIYEHSTATGALKDLFVRAVDQIIWSHKLAPETINLAATPAVAELQVFRIVQREPVLSLEVLRAIDRAIPFPLLFELAQGGKIKLVAAYKQPVVTPKGETDRTKWVLGDYFEGDWLPEDAPRRALPVALTLGALYEQLLEPLVEVQTARLVQSHAVAPPQGIAPHAPVSLETRIAHAEALQATLRTVDRIKARLAREKQFNKRMAVYAELRAAQQALAQLTGAAPGPAPVQD